jgi:hypothetical protein
MGKRIVILENCKTFLKNMEEVSRYYDHEVLAIWIQQTTDLKSAVAQIKKFNPHLVFLNHDFCREESGNEVAKMLGFPAGKLVGTSRRWAQPYCGHIFSEKDMIRYCPWDLRDLIAAATLGQSG